MSSRLKLIHLSDFHFHPTPNLPFSSLFHREFYLKNLQGWFNYRFNRRYHFHEWIKEKISKKLDELRWDYLVVTGDLTNYSRDEEFLEAKKFLEPFYDKGQLILLPGNHDRYVPSRHQIDPLRRHFPNSLPFGVGGDSFEDCFLELTEDVVLIVMDMCQPRGIFSSNGKLIGDLAEYEKVVRLKYKNHLKIAAGHFPVMLPDEIHQKKKHTLLDREKVAQFLVKNEISLYLHGHIHKSWILNPRQDDIYFVNSGGCFRHASGGWAGFHKIEIENGKIELQRILIDQD